ncbi:MAG: hypothetical protein EU547_03435 [Promethearchaeota archaeon]|nr:MAG: hypothetical protein EU547_03435 [Candidatus Lokiarchaeota archaeon]
MPIPAEFLWNIPEKEKIFFVSPNLKRRRVQLIHLSLYPLITIGMSLFFLIIMFLSNVFEFWIGIIIVIIVFPFFLRIMLSDYKKDQYILITDKYFRILTYWSQKKMEYLNEITLKSIIGINYDKSLLDSRGDYGDVELIQEIDSPNSRDQVIAKSGNANPIWELKNIPNFKQFQITFESILYEFGSFKSKWEEIEKKFNLNFPIEVPISGEKLRKVNNRRIKLIIFSILIPLICGGIFSLSFIFPLNYETIGGLGIILGMVIYFIVPYLGIFLPIGFIIEAFFIQKRKSSRNSKLIFDGSRILYEKENNLKEIPITNHTMVIYEKIEKPLNSLIKWHNNIDGLLLFPVDEANEKIRFGPIENFPQIYCGLIHQLLSWKAKMGILYNRNQLENQIKRYEIETKTRKHRLRYSDLSLEQKREYSFKTEEPSTSIQKKFGQYLKLNDKVLLSYKPSINFFVNIIGILISILFGVISFYYILTLTDWNDFISILLIIPVMLIIIGLSIAIIDQISKINTKLEQNKSLFIFTSEKIFKSSKYSHSVINYKNLREIGKSRRYFQYKTYSVKIYFKSAINHTYSLSIEYIPNENQLVEKIRYLHKNIDKYKK